MKDELDWIIFPKFTIKQTNYHLKDMDSSSDNGISSANDKDGNPVNHDSESFADEAGAMTNSEGKETDSDAFSLSKPTFVVPFSESFRSACKFMFTTPYHIYIHTCMHISADKH